MNNALNWIIKKEPYIFFILVILNLYTILLIDFYYSLDAPQHLYVANIIAELFRGNEEISKFILINDLIVGYWTGTFLLSLFKLFMMSNLAVKLLLVIYYTSIAYSFRYLVRSVKKEPTLLTLLIIPFSATFFIGSGYYNFSLATGLMFLCLGYFIRTGNKVSWKAIVVMMLLLLLLFLTHAFVFAFTGLLLTIYVLYDFFRSWYRTAEIGNSINALLKSVRNLALASLPSVALWIYYVVSIQDVTRHFKVDYKQPGTLFENLIDIKALSWFATEPHELINRYLLSLLIFLVLFTVVIKLVKIYKKKQRLERAEVLILDYGLVSVLMVTAFYFLYPDTLITGNLSLRLLVLLYFVLIFWLATQNYPKLISILVLLVIIPVSFLKWDIRMQYLPKLSAKAQKIKEISRSMEDNSVYITIDYYQYWAEYHFPVMPGIDKPLIYANAPQIHGQHPLMINKETCPRIYLGSKGPYYTRLFWGLSGTDSVPIRPADYVLRINLAAFNGTPVQQIAMKEINKYYILTDSSSNRSALLYELRNRNQLMKEYMAFSEFAAEEARYINKPLSVVYQDKYLELLNKHSLKTSELSESDSVNFVKY